MSTTDYNAHNFCPCKRMTLFCSTGTTIWKRSQSPQSIRLCSRRRDVKRLESQRGENMVIIAYDSRNVLIPERSIQEARGSLKGMDVAIERDEENRL